MEEGTKKPTTTTCCNRNRNRNSSSSKHNNSSSSLGRRHTSTTTTRRRSLLLHINNISCTSFSSSVSNSSISSCYNISNRSKTRAPPGSEDRSWIKTLMIAVLQIRQISQGNTSLSTLPPWSPTRPTITNRRGTIQGSSRVSSAASSQSTTTLALLHKLRIRIKSHKGARAAMT